LVKNLNAHLQAIRKLSTHEREILLHLAQYKTMRQIAESDSRLYQGFTC